MLEPIYLNEDFKAKWRQSFEQARADREGYFIWIKDEILKAIDLINKYDKIYVLGGLGARLLKVAPNFHNQFMEMHKDLDREDAENEEVIDDNEIEILLEYAMSLASASPNTNAGNIPTAENIEEIRIQLSKIKFNIGFYENSAGCPTGGTEFDHWLKIKVMEDALHVRGQGYNSHILEIYKETFAPHDGFLEQYYVFNSNDILQVVKRLTLLVASKIGNVFGGFLSHQRLTEWHKEKGEEAIHQEMKSTGDHFIKQFGADNPDLYDDKNPDHFTLLHLDHIKSYNKLFWVIPKTDKEKLIFELLSHQLGDNNNFLEGKFGGFPLGDSIIQNKPLIKVDNKYYCFSITLPFRNIFNITANLLQSASAVYYEHSFKGNTNTNSRDNYIELKTKQLFEKTLPTVQFVHSLKYNIIEDEISKETELDILGFGADTIYIIEVKAGELNKKHRRGAILGLKDRLKEIVNEGSYQCYRAEKFIRESESPEFSYIENNQKNILTIDKSKEYQIIKISVTFEHFSTVSVNLKYLIESGVLSPDYKWTWIVSLFDLMIFSDLIESEQDFKEYIHYRLGIYERNDIEFQDEKDILNYFMENKFPLPPEKEGEKQVIISLDDEIETYYRRKDAGLPGIEKPRRIREK